MEKFVESFDDYLSKKRLNEESEVAEFNRKLSDKINLLKDSRDNAAKWKEKYETLLKDNEDTKEIEYALLKYKSYKGHADMLEADVKLMKMDKGKKALDKDDKEQIEKDKDKIEDKKD